MRFALVSALVVGLSGCASSDNPTGRQPEQTFAITGVVRDSVLQTAVAGATVSIGSLQAETDFAGSYHLESVPGGPAQLTISVDGFRPYTRALTVASTHAENAQLVRTAPWVASISRYGSRGVAVRWSDLEGDFPSGQAVLSADYGGSTSIAYSTGSYRVDALTMEYDFPLGGDAVRLNTRLTDQGGHAASFTCTFASGCTEVR